MPALHKDMNTALDRRSALLPTKVGSLTEAASPEGTLSWDTLPSSEHQ
jgi:hypothetical protein